jgi:hypothetical protein
VARQCSKCNFVAGDLAKFCDKCGSRLGDTKERFNFKAFGLGIGLVALVVALLFAVALTRRVGPPASTDPASSDAPASSHVVIGETAKVKGASGYWPCGSSEAAFNELIKWAGLHDEAELKRTLARTHSIGVLGGMQVKVLDSHVGIRKIRILTNDAGEGYLRDEKGVFASDSRIGRECWIAPEALTAIR